MGKIWDIIKSLFSKVSFKNVLKAVFSTAITTVLGSVWDIAKDTVENVNREDLTDEAKRSESFARIKATAVEEGKDIKDSLINLLIELAVSYAKVSLK